MDWITFEVVNELHIKKGHFYGAIRKLTYLKKLFCLANSINVDAMLETQLQ